MQTQPLLIALACYATSSSASLIAMAIDKQRARANKKRIPEKTLHTLELLGGFPGAIAAMQLFKHKRRKPRFWLVTCLIAILHAAAWIAFWQLTTSAG